MQLGRLFSLLSHDCIGEIYLAIRELNDTHPMSYPKILMNVCIRVCTFTWSCYTLIGMVASFYTFLFVETSHSIFQWERGMGWRRWWWRCWYWCMATATWVIVSFTRKLIQNPVEFTPSQASLPVSSPQPRAAHVNLTELGWAAVELVLPYNSSSSLPYLYPTHPNPAQPNSTQPNSTQPNPAQPSAASPLS